jgi:LacI family transcriptional regulator
MEVATAPNASSRWNSWRGVLTGIGRYCREHQSWAIRHDFQGGSIEWLGSVDGIIIRGLQSPELIAAVKSARVPVVDTLGSVEGLPLVHIDDDAIGERGAQYFLERGFKHFGFCGIEDSHWSMKRRDAFVRSTAAASAAVLELKFGEGDWEQEQRLLATFIEKLPRPAAVMGCHDPVGQRILTACQALGARVPDDVAVLSVDNDEPFCEVADPPLSSVISNHVGVGYEAAALLDRLMAGAEPPHGPILLKPAGVAARTSTDVIAVEDPHIAAAARFIREHACDGIGVEDVVDQVPFSHTILQRRFKLTFGRSVHEEIVETRVRRAKQLLVETDLSLAQIAERVGIGNPEYFGVVFKSKTGQTPMHFRREIRGKTARPGDFGRVVTGGSEDGR